MSRCFIGKKQGRSSFGDNSLAMTTASVEERVIPEREPLTRSKRCVNMTGARCL